MKLLIKNAHLLSLRDNLDDVGDILVENGKIKCIDLGQQGQDVAEHDTIDAAGLCLAPGLVDLFANAHEPEQEGLESVLSLSNAAAKGGYTTVCASLGITTSQEAEYVRERANYASCDIVTAARATQEKEILNYGELKEWGVRAVYDDAGVDNPLRMRDAMFRARKHNMLLMSRCRDKRLYGEGLMREGDLARVLDFPIIPASAETVVVARDIILAMESGSHVHLGHISTALSVKIIRMGKLQGANVTCSTQPHYVGLSSAELVGYNTLAKLDPPLGNQADIDALIEGLQDGTIDCIASGHTPLPAAAKRMSLVNSAPGASSLETALAASLTALYHSGKMELARVLDKLTAAPAAVLGLDCGRLRVGDDADFVIFDPNAKWVCKGGDFVSRGKNTPYEGKELMGRPVYTIKAGRIITES